MTNEEVVAWTTQYMPLFAEAFMAPEYRFHANTIALANMEVVLTWRNQIEDEFDIPIEHAVLIYALIQTDPYRSEYRTAGGEQDPPLWISTNYFRFLPTLETFVEGGTTPPVQSQINIYEAAQFAVFNGEQQFNLPYAPKTILHLFINGLDQNKNGCTVTGSNLRVNASYDILSGDYISVRYLAQDQ